MSEICVERLHKENYEELIAFIDLVFSQDFFAIHFQDDIPIAFGPTEERMQYQYVVREDGRIRAAIGVIPYTLLIGNERFTIRGITNVATHYKYTGRGYMSMLLKRAFSDMKEENVDLAMLVGHRERYRYFGFESVAEDIYATYAAYNIPHRQKMGESMDFSFRDIKVEDHEAWDRMMKLYDTFPMRYERPRKDLPEHVASWSSGAREIYRADGSYAGYMVLSKRWDFAVREIRLYEPKELTRVLNTLLLQEKKETVTLNVSPFDYELLNEIYETAEDIRSVQMCRINLLKPERFIAACLNTKQDLGGELPQGSLVIDGVLGRFEIVNDGRFSVSETKKPAQISLPDHLFYPFVFGPVPQSMSQFPELPVKFRSWFPAPFYIPSIDRY